MNIRVVIPYLVEFLHDETGARVLRLYKAVDIICIWLAFITFFAYLRQQFTAWESSLACLYFAAILPLTFGRAKYPGKSHSFGRVSAPSSSTPLSHFWIRRMMRRALHFYHPYDRASLLA
jgi:hypothetical protein